MGSSVLLKIPLPLPVISYGKTKELRKYNYKCGEIPVRLLQEASNNSIHKLL